ncbi:retinitis pigmentosa 1-like 1 protein [Dicentrarchus labrax]|uniref:retinitis pigmentosa 1-like 1 protein n=1 Tax=Dicentrarchus labrax TaxID=13489 RepID=UPI0021F630F2|nr:retinitis pigmentosa 1-like 1 protein [Dicentrarchus labrax]
MHSVQAGMWDPRPPSKHASHLPLPHLSNSRLAHVTTATPAKRITFYKSGDSQFGGIRMAVHKRSFKCFDALLDDLSQKVPLPFGVRTVTTPRGTHAIKHLEQLQDGGCYLCSDRRHAKPVNMELASKRPGIWSHHSQKPHRPETLSATPPGHLSYRQRRILLVKNTEPGMRRSIVLGRRSTRSLRAFLDEVSEVMQFHVRKLYTAEGRRIDSVQSLITCPGVLVCVGREAFSPMLVNFIRKSSEEKLPGLGSRSPGLGPRTPGNGARSPATQGARSPPHGAQSRASEYSEGHESKKNVNFGLETKKSIIHPRSDSSNRSARFSLSSEKSYSNGISAYSQARPGIMNEDIEKRVVVNKDGSLSVEMRVRFRLHNEETLQWSTQIKKSPSLSNESCPLSQAQPHYLQQGQSESCSDPDSTTFEPEGVDYCSQPLPHVSAVNHCPCCYQRQEQQYDLWENPAHSHKKPPVPPPHTSSHTMMRHTHSSSSSSSCNSRRVVRCRARLSNCGGGSGSEQSQLLQEDMCVTEQVERRVEVEKDGDTHVKVHRVSRCCSRSEVLAVDSNLRPLSQKSLEDELLVEDDGLRPLSAVSSSSHVLQSLREDEDDDDLPPSASQCCHSIEPSQSPAHLNDKPKSNISSSSIHSTEHNKHEDGEERGSRAVSAASSCHYGATTPHSTAEAEEMELGTRSKMSRASCRSSKVNIPTSEEAADDEDEELKRVVSGLSGHTGLSADSRQSRASSACHNCGGCKHGRSPSALSAQSNLSAKSSKSHKANCSGTAEAKEEAEGENAADRPLSSLSAKSGTSSKTSASVKLSNKVASPTDNTAVEEVDTNERTPSALSVKSNASDKPGMAERPDSVLSAKSAKSTKSNVSAKSGTSHRSTCSHCPRAVSPGDKAADEPVIEATEQEEGMETEERAASAMSAKSHLSARSNKSHKFTKASERSLSPRSETGGDCEKRAASQLSGRSVKSDMSVKSSKSCKPKNNGDEIPASPSSMVAEEKENEMVEEETQERPESVMSAKLENEERAASARSSKSHKSNYNENTGASLDTGDGEKAEDRAASALSGKSASSAKSHHTNCEASSRVASPTKDTAETEDRIPSAMSGKSHISAKSSKSQKSNRTAASPNPNDANVPSIETNEEEKQNQERVASAMSVKSKSSVRSSTSHKSNSNKNLKSVSPNPNIVTIKTPEVVDEEGNETTERAPSAASAKSGKSASSHKSNHNGAADITVTETVDVDEKVVEDNAPKSKSSEQSNGQMLSPRTTRSPRTHSPKAPTTSPRSPQAPVQQLLPGPDTRGASALSVRSTTSAKSCRSKCRCGAASAKKEKEVEGKEVEDKEMENKDNNEELKNEEASERAASVLSSSTKRSRRESGGTEQPLSRNSSGSVSLGLPEDQETADSDSGRSSASFHINTESKSRVKTATPKAPSRTEQSAMKEDVEETGSTKSQKSNKNGSKSTLSHNPPAVDIPTIETPGQSEDKGEEGAEQKSLRAASACSAKSNRSHKSSCKYSVKSESQMLGIKPKEKHARTSTTKVEDDLETTSVKSASTVKAHNLDAPNNRTSSAMSSASAKIRCKSPACSSVKNANVAKTSAGDSAHNDAENQAVSRPASEAEGKEDPADNDAASVHSKGPCCLRPESAASAHSNCLNPVKCHKAKSSSSVKTSHSQKKETPIKSSSPCPSQNSRPGSKGETCSESLLSHSLSAADLLKEIMAAARPHSRQSKASKTSDKPRSEKSARCQRSRNQVVQEELELTPACLPNASPNEVVSDWLRSIPTNSSMLEFGDESHQEEEEQEKAAEEKPGEEAAKEESPEEEKVDNKEEVEAEEEEEKEKEEEAECEVAEKEKSSDPAPGDAVGTSSRNNTLLLSGESVPRNWHSSAAVMKVLLSSSTGRCQSMPEVSPVYGRRLSTSARGFLDCLAQLQLIEPAVNPSCDQQKDRNQRYEDIMAILQSLWLTDPKDIDVKQAGEVGREQVTPPRSSSGVDMSSGSGGSGKENGNGAGDETKQNITTNEEEVLNEDKEAEKVAEEEEEENAEAGNEEVEEKEETDTAQEPERSEEQSSVPPSLDSPKATENPSSSDANDSSKSPTDNERETMEDSSSSTPPTVLRAPLSKKQSQDPDPVWILHLLKKLEKQFMNHYINAMAEFKVRWDLDDSLILDTMISELRDEVSRRIQSSIEREIRKIQSRAGKGGRSPRPPHGGNLSRESTMTDRRRRILKVMKNQSVKTADTLSDEELTGEFSDQRSEDEYCPCDACVRKKMAARPLKANPLAAEAPMMIEFDLLKILQLKKSPLPPAVPPPAVEEVDSIVIDQEERNLEVLHEEEEEDETKEDIKATVVLEETIPEEDEEIEEKEDGGEEGEEKEAEEEKEVSDEEQEEEETGGEEAGEEEETGGEEAGEEEETGGEEAGEEETTDNGEDEEEAQCQCQCGKNEEESDKAEEGEEGEGETSNNTGEDETAEDEERTGEEEGESAEEEVETEGNEGETGTGEEEEESDKETVKDATAGEEDTTENGEGEEEAEAEECEVCDFKPEEEEETTSKESGAEASGETEDDSATKDTTNEESTPVEGNDSASAEAEDEDDGDDGSGEGEASEEQEREVSEEERPSTQGQGVTEGEEADAEDSSTDSKRQSDTSPDESGREGAAATGDEEEKEGGGDGADEEFKPEEDGEDEEVNKNKREASALLHQFTRTSVESQPGSLEDIDTESPQNPGNLIEVPKMADGGSTGGGTGQKRSRSPARVKRRKPKESDVELDDI